MLHRLEFHAMGCEMLAVVDGESTPSLLAQVPEWFEEWEQVLSRFRYDSELTRLNQTHEQPVRVSDTLWSVLQTAHNAERMTDGLVTPTLLDAIIEAGYDRPFDVLPRQTPLVRHPVLTAPQPLTAIAVDESTQTVALPSGMSLDFGGSAKGWAAHQAMKRLQADGPALVNAGGDITVSGLRADGSPWQIGIANPFQREENIETLFLEACGIATSGKDRRRWTRNGVLQHHISDPATSQPAETDLLTVTVIAPDVMQAEAAAKAAFILGSRVGLEWIEARSELAALFILDDGQVLYSEKMEEFL
ncbi:MAG TPA: FAD:protein FMN transferase [Anaerolineales bacterium]|nr:FAD:protein FMN transferase [Anaerolineales bacterium]